MRPSEAVALHRHSIIGLARQWKLDNPRVFGSVVHGLDRDGSDLDLLVDAPEGITLFDLGGLQSDLEDLLGLAVDLRTPEDLPLVFRDEVLSEARAL
ncbi:nucleotidyltransferase domain protein [Komagataeibacter europaeus]|uniref:Nucleotidyltransferase domain protein n=1 Tax=Komagataeibacter europaeus TaxID=33995 RepID=A0A0M0ECJ4_KOMEU|nr:nucleotidyltransferase family protein [Komagataeibacter europaeus]KON62691.1 nucleotidyltransferase domain protein [Komagataeibacter europaeus]